MSASSCCVTCGTLTQLACSRGPEIFWMRDSGSVSMRPYFAKSTAGTAGSALAAAPPPPSMTSLTNALTSSAVTRPFAPEPRTRPRSTPSSRASLRTDGLACASPNDVGALDSELFAGAAARGAAGLLSGSGRDADGCDGAAVAPRAGAEACGAAAAAGCAAAPVSPVSSVAITLPADTRSPVLTLSAVIFPAAGDGMSIVALSVSSVTRPCSAATESPGFTRTSMTSTSAKSPRSGTTTSTG